MCTDDFDLRQALVQAYELGLTAARAGVVPRVSSLVDAAGSNVVSFDRRQRIRRTEDRTVVADRLDA